jgi:hypothetical protein
VILAAPVVPGAKALVITLPEVRRIAKETGCDQELETISADSVAVDAIDATHSLVLLRCGSGAYNFMSMPFVASGRGKAVRLAPARFDHAPEEPNGGTMLVNAAWEPGRRLLTTFAKGRGLGDCGTAQEYAWDGATFRLSQLRRMDECRGSADWITLWRARVR